MNPEFVRNLWLELTPRRVALMLGILVLLFFAVVVAGGTQYSVFGTAQWLYYMIVVFWGTRNASMAVIGEIRDRTWDLQRLSSIGPAAMTIGKLFGATAYNWLGGLICLVVMTAVTFAQAGPLAAFLDLVYYLIIGVMTQALTLLASLIAIHRGQRHSRLDIFIYQTVGLVGAIAVFAVWNAADPEGTLLKGKLASDTVIWWGLAFEARSFLLLSLAIFMGWTLLASYREMRLELKMQNGSLVWLAWLVFIGVYVSGFDAWLSQNETLSKWDYVALRLALATTTYVILSYVMVFLEPKNRVLYRWLGAQLGSGRVGSLLSNLQAWMLSYSAAMLVAVALIMWAGRHEGGDILQDQFVLASGLGFFTRDMGIFILMSALTANRRGDLAALGALFSLYVLVPAILQGMGLEQSLVLFFPKPATPIWLGAVAAWLEAVGVFVLISGRLAIGNRAATASA